VVNAGEFLAGRRIAVLATADADGSPYLTPVWFEWVDGAFHVPTSATSRKARNARARPRGAIVVDARGPRVCGVAASGPLEVVGGAAAAALNERIHRRYVTDAGMADRRLGVVLAAGDDVTLRLLPDDWRTWDLEPVFGDPRLMLTLDD
jgi:PPOX class probable F420-dependent enzyme